MIPVNTSPVPAVARRWLALRTKIRSPLVSLTSVVGPLRRTALFLAALRTAAHRSKAGGEPVSFSNSPSCGVSTVVEALRITHVGWVATAVRPSASTTVGMGDRSISSAVIATVSGSVPRPGPMSRAANRSRSFRTSGTKVAAVIFR